jgi:hypothetical protein
MKLSPIVRLQDHWWTNHCKDLQQGNGNARCSLVHNRNAEEELHSVVIIIEEKAKQSIRHALKIYQVGLTLRSKTMSDDGLQSRDWTIMQLMLYADRAQVGEHFTDNPANILYSFAHTLVQCSPLHVILPMHLSDIAESMLKICYPFHKIEVNVLLSNNVWWPCNKHDTVSIDNKSKRLLLLIDG